MTDTATPITRSERITNLDTVRGIATLGILVMNAVSFGLPQPAYFNLDYAGSDNTLDWIVGVYTFEEDGENINPVDFTLSLIHI